MCFKLRLDVYESQSIFAYKSYAIKYACIQSEYRKIRTRKNSVFGHFQCSTDKCKNFEAWLNRESFCPKSFLPLKYLKGNQVQWNLPKAGIL